MLFDNNSISIDGPTNLAVSDNFKKRFEGYGWNYILINGHNYNEIFKALKKVQNSKKPTVISCKTKIGYGSPNKSGKASSHGSPLGKDEIELVRKKLGWMYKPFEIPKNILNEWNKIGNKGSKIENKWNKTYNKKKNNKTDPVKTRANKTKSNKPNSPKKDLISSDEKIADNNKKQKPAQKKNQTEKEKSNLQKKKKCVIW